MNENGSKKPGSCRDVIIAQKTMISQHSIFYGPRRELQAPCPLEAHRSTLITFLFL
jgi:hypothetical protein